MTGGNRAIEEILELAHRTECLARDLYSKFAELAPDSDLKVFWTELSDDEGSHLDFWANLSEMCKSLPISLPVEDPEALRTLLENAMGSAEKLLDEAESGDARHFTLSRTLLAAYRLELYMLDSSFQTLFQSLRFLQEDFDPVSEYEHHIGRFVEGLATFGAGIPETELLSETLSRLWRENRRLASLALEDGLTGVLNRRGFMTMALQICSLLRRSGEAAGVLMIDLDDFKGLNDSRGHTSGDSALRMTADVLTGTLRESDLIGRYGGDEFVVLLPETTDTERVCDKVRRELDRALGRSFGITATVGFAQGFIHCDEVEECLIHLIDGADTKLYAQKSHIHSSSESSFYGESRSADRRRSKGE